MGGDCVGAKVSEYLFEQPFLQLVNTPQKRDHIEQLWCTVAFCHFQLQLIDESQQ